MNPSRRLSWIEAHGSEMEPYVQRAMQFISARLKADGCSCDPDVEPSGRGGRLRVYHERTCVLADSGEQTISLKEIRDGGTV